MVKCPLNPPKIHRFTKAESFCPIPVGSNPGLDWFVDGEDSVGFLKPQKFNPWLGEDERRFEDEPAFEPFSSTGRFQVDGWITVLDREKSQCLMVSILILKSSCTNQSQELVKSPKFGVKSHHEIANGINACHKKKVCLSTHSCCFDPPYLVGYTFILDCLMLCLPPFSWWNPNFWGLNPVKSAFLRGSRMLNPYVQWLIHPISQVFSPHRSLPESWNGQGTPE